MNKTCLEIQNHTKYLLNELNHPGRKEKIENSEFSDYFTSITQLLYEIVKLNTKALTLDNIANLVIPLQYRAEYTEQGVLNAFFELEIQFWSVIRYCENYLKEDSEVKRLKTLIINTTERISRLTPEPKLLENFTDILNAIKEWNSEYKSIKTMFRIKRERYDLNNPFQRLTLKYKEKYREVDPFLFILNYIFWIFLHYKIRITPRIKHDLTLLTTFNIIRTQDIALFISTPRQKEMFSYSNLNEIIDKIKKPNVKRVLDLFANTGFTSIIGYIFNKSYIQINDMSYSNKQSLANYFMDDINQIYQSNFSPDINVDTAFDQLEESPEYHRRHEQFIKDRYTSDTPYVPISSTSLNPKAIFAMLGVPIDIAKNYNNIVHPSNVKISKETTARDININKFDLIIIDPPFGVVSKYQVTEDQGKELLEYAIKLVSNLLNKKGLVFIRIKKDWKLPNIPTNWEEERKTIGGKVKPKFYCFRSS